MGYSSVRHEEKLIVKKVVGMPAVVDMDDQERDRWWLMEEERRPMVVEKKVHHQIQKLRVEDSKLGVDVKEVLVNGKYKIVGGEDGRPNIASVVMFSRPAALPASPLGGKTPINPAC